MVNALGSPNFRTYYFGQVFSFAGNLIQEVALAWLIYRLTGEAFYVGLLLFMKQLATFLLSPLAGVLSDRVSRRMILLTTNTTMALLSCVMGALVIKSYYIIPAILVIQFMTGIVNGIDMPVRQAFIKNLVSDSQLMNAIALNSSVFNIARIIGPALAGILIPATGEAMCFIINGMSYLPIIIGILLMKNLPNQATNKKMNVLTDIREGLAYSFSHPPLRVMIVVTAAIGFFGFPHNTLLPVFTRKVLNGNEQTLSLLITAIGIGSLISAFFMAIRKNTAGLSVLVCLACTVYGLGFVFLSYTQHLLLAMIMLIQVGIGQVLIFSSASSILQTMADPKMTGRVLSFYIMAFMGATTLGSLITGVLADSIGVVSCLFLCGSGCIVTSIFLLFFVKSIKKRMIIKLKLRNVRKLFLKELHIEYDEKSRNSVRPVR